MDTPARPARREDRWSALVEQFQTVRFDGWGNLFQGLGVRGRDPSLGDFVMPPVLMGPAEEDWLYRGDAIAARLVDLLPDEATREGWRLRVDQMAPGEDVAAEEANEIADAMVRYGRKLKAKQRLRQGLSLGRLHGGALAVFGLDDGREPEEPVDEANIRAVRWVQILGRHQVTPGPLEIDTRSPNFGEPASYQLSNVGPIDTMDVHASRVIRFGGVWSPTVTGSTGAHEWDDSVLTRLREPLAQFNLSVKSINRIIRDFSRVVQSIKDLSSKMKSNDLQAIRMRLEGGELSASVLNAYLKDPAETIEFVTRQVAGLADLFDRQSHFLAASAGYPITQLIGVSPGGLGTGEDEDKRFTNLAKAYQNDFVHPVVERYATLCMLAKDGPTGGRLPAKWDIVFSPLRTPSAKEIAEMRSTIMTAIAKLVEMQILLPAEAAESMFGRGEWSMDITLDRDQRDAMLAEQGVPYGTVMPPEEEHEEPDDGGEDDEEGDEA